MALSTLGYELWKSKPPFSKLYNSLWVKAVYSVWLPYFKEIHILSVFICYSVTQSFPTLCDPMDYSTPGFSVLHNPLEFAQTHVHWISDIIQPAHTLSSPSPPALNLFPSVRVFSNESALRMRWPKYWSFSFSISPSNEHSGVISFRMDWLDLLADQGTLKSLLQHHS